MSFLSLTAVRGRTICIGLAACGFSAAATGDCDHVVIELIAIVRIAGTLCSALRNMVDA